MSFYTTQYSKNPRIVMSNTVRNAMQDWVDTSRFSSGSSTTGPIGPTGSQGIQGQTGPQGPAGTASLTGATGPQGPTGVQGSQGPTGSQGVIGATGVAGPTGVQGSQGPTGSQGVIGATGVAGPTGSQGVQGIQGLMGPTGFQGPQGVQGPTGAPGATGSQGIQGMTGPSFVNSNIYASYYSNTTQLTRGVNVPTLFAFDHIACQSGVTLTGATGPTGHYSRMVVPEAGTYEVGMSIQFNQTQGGNHNAIFWARINGTDVPDSTTNNIISGPNWLTCPVILFFFELNKNDYVEFVFTGQDSSVGAYFFPENTGVYPATPSIISYAKVIGKSVGITGPTGASNTTNIRKALNHATGTSTAGSASPGTVVSTWSTSYTGTGRNVQVTANFSAFSNVGGGTNFYLLRDGVVQDTSYFYFNNTNIHHTIPNLIGLFPAETGVHTYAVSIGSNVVVDIQDRCLMTIMEY
jgi:hypothetical protein